MKKLLISGIVCAAAILIGKETLFPILKSNALIGKQAENLYLLPSNQLIRPWGEQSFFSGRPVDMTFDSRKRVLAVLNTRSIIFHDGSTGARLQEVQARSTSYAGIAFRPGDRELWASETTRNGPDAILVVPIAEDGKAGKPEHIELPGHPLPTGLAFSANGKTAYVAFSRNNSLAIFDVESRKLQREVPVGNAPFGVALLKQRGKILISNRAGRRAGEKDTTAPSSGTNIVTDPTTGSATSGTLSIVDAETFAVRDVEVGLAPSNITVAPDESIAVITNGHSDSISIIETKNFTRTEVHVPSYPDAMVGSQPIAAAFTPDAKRLYVACGGNNAIAILERAGKSWKIAGAVPTGWFPTAVALAADNSLRVLNLKGKGSTDNHKGAFNARSFEGSLLRIPAPTPAQISAGLREVQVSNMPTFEAAGGVSDLKSLGIEHVFLIVKENRTYDQVFGDMGRGNGDPKYCMYGREVSPNHHALADQFVLIDNFYTGGAISFDGHQWLMQAFVSDYVERAFAASPRGYAWNMSDALGVPPSGFFWQSPGKPLDVRIYGEFQLPAKFDVATRSAVDMNEHDILSWAEYMKAYREGTWRPLVGSRSGVPALQPICSQSYPFNNTLIPDQLRAEDYITEFKEREKSGKLPQLSILTLNSDHTNGTRPGSATPKSMVADNDLALGRIVEAISHSRFWPKTLILVTEDDAQDGLDHVDGHRTIALAIGPHIRRGAIDSNNYTHTSMIRTIQDILGIKPRSKFLVNARAMTGSFTSKADLTPFTHLPTQSLEEYNPPLKALQGRQLWAAKQSAAMNWNDVDDVPHDTLNRILWWDAKGWNTPYPK